MPGPEWIRRYDRHCQLIFAYSQHHWHSLDDTGNRVPMKYSAVKRKRGTKKSDKICKMRYPRPLNSSIRSIRKGSCKEFEGRCSGRRSMLGTIAPIRTDNWFAETSAVLSAIVNANTNMQVPYKIPLTERTHDLAYKLKCVRPSTLRCMWLKMHQSKRM